MGYNFNDVPDVPVELPLGEHLVTITAAQNDTTKSGTAFYRIEFADDLGRVGIASFYKSKAALPYFKKFLRICGLTDAELQDFEFDMLLRRRVYVRMVEETGNDGKMYIKVDTFRWRQYEGDQPARPSSPAPAYPNPYQRNPDPSVGHPAAGSQPSPVGEDGLPF
jgi:hypothetical protein